MKEEIEKKHFEHTCGSGDEPRCRATPQVEVCAFRHNLSHGFYRVMSVTFLFGSTGARYLLHIIHLASLEPFVQQVTLSTCSVEKIYLISRQ